MRAEVGAKLTRARRVVRPVRHRRDDVREAVRGLRVRVDGDVAVAGDLLDVDVSVRGEVGRPRSDLPFALEAVARMRVVAGATEHDAEALKPRERDDERGLLPLGEHLQPIP